ncbi:MAG: GNAT family N-acetyltransferase [Deltaproteobacteria bacterium]|nr:GNAT family N-acetyltransferase [Deltaproteobacteria bacterium]
MAEIAYHVARNEDELAGHFALRHAVFVEEQGLFEETDRDHHDPEALHIVAIDVAQGSVVGAVRCYPEKDGVWFGGRLAVMATYRHHASSIGARLCRLAVHEMEQRQVPRFIAHIQRQNVRFFQRMGWRKVGDTFLHRDQPHQLMEAPLREASEGKSSSASTAGTASHLPEQIQKTKLRHGDPEETGPHRAPPVQQQASTNHRA